MAEGQSKSEQCCSVTASFLSVAEVVRDLVNNQLTAFCMMDVRPLFSLNSLLTLTPHVRACPSRIVKLSLEDPI